MKARAGGAPSWPALDGLRAIAVIGVVMFHAEGAPNGFDGVDVFFALSGFLITALLLREHAASDQISLGRFYARRLLRLYPALAALVAGVIVLAIIAHKLATAAPAAAATLIYMAHIYIYGGHDAWLLDHTWTLSLEEHFYLFWPPVLALVLRPGRRRWIGAALLGAGLVVVAAPGILPGPIRGAYLRATPMALGSAAAFVEFKLPMTARSRRVLSSASGALLIPLVVLTFWPVGLPSQIMTGPTSVPGWLAAIIVLGFVLEPASIVSRGLSLVPLRWIGRRSYGLYLYHFPILSIAIHQIDFGVPQWLRALASVGATVVVASVSYRWLELPLLRFKRRFESHSTPTRVTVGIAAASGVQIDRDVSPS